MTHRYVIDTHALREIGNRAGNNSGFFDPLTALMHRHELTFPHAVVRDCKDYCHGEPLWMWVNAVERFRLNSGNFDHSYTEIVLEDCLELFDEYDLNEDQAPVRTAAMALYMGDSNGQENISVVTEDRLEHPLRINLASACTLLGLETLGVTEFLAAI